MEFTSSTATTSNSRFLVTPSSMPCRAHPSPGRETPLFSIPTRGPGDERIRIGMVHGSTFDVVGCQTNFPIAVDAAIQRGLDYLAIGDTHGFRFVPPDRTQPPTVYPGAPEQTAFGEKDAGYVAVVLMNRQRRAIVQKESVAQWRWEECTITSIEQLRALRNRNDLANRVLRLTMEIWRFRLPISTRPRGFSA